ncbi:MAG TPA: winged helix-turn-helix domain-containing protein [Vicinamibacteria bacterium]|nr:winged helix-turn-helix domain-containing protein [Vicinamibacteria bacterium]
MHVRFGEFVLDGGTRQLRRGEEERRLGPKAFALLELLLSQRPNVVARERIRDRLWPGTFVSESTLATVVAEVRAALDEDPKAPRFLRTVHRVGYAFCGAAVAGAPRREAPPGMAAYRLLLHDREVMLRPGENLLGRVEDGAAVLEDLGSKNGTFLRGRRITGPAPLADGDELRVGRVTMTLRAVLPDEDTRTAGG